MKTTISELVDACNLVPNDLGGATMSCLRAIQIMESFATLADAWLALDTFSSQVGFLGGRVLTPDRCNSQFRMQAFVDDPQVCGQLPDGMRRVVIPKTQIPALFAIRRGH